MFGAVIITFVITALSALALFQYDSGKKLNRENSRLHQANDNLNRRISDMTYQDNARREKDAYNRGLYDARETDELYRKMLKKYTAGERVTVMMHGDDNDDRRKG